MKSHIVNSKTLSAVYNASIPAMLKLWQVKELKGKLYGKAKSRSLKFYDIRRQISYILGLYEMVDTDNRREFAGSMALLMRRADAISCIGSSIPRRFRFSGCRIFYSLTLHLCIDRSSKKNAIYGQEEPNH
jgi:hypothetical protein